jgi:hypothetical protein
VGVMCNSLSPKEKYRLNNKTKISTYNKSYYLQRKEEISNYKKQYYNSHKEALSVKNEIYYKQHRDNLRQRKQETKENLLKELSEDTKVGEM